MKKMVTASARMMVLALVGMMGWSPVALANPQIHVLNVGYGSAVHLEFEDQNFLFDTGSKQTSSLVLEHLAKSGVTRLQAVFLTHTHPDHAGGVLPLLRSIPIDRVYWNGLLADEEDMVDQLTQAQKETSFLILQPGEKIMFSKNFSLQILNSTYQTSDINDQSLVYGLTFKRLKLLLPGDVGPERQKNLVKLESNWLKGVRFMLWPHHGDVLEQDFLNLFKKKLVCVVSVEENEKGLPKSTLEEQSKKICHQIFRTDQQGDLHFILVKDILQIPPHD